MFSKKPRAAAKIETRSLPLPAGLLALEPRYVFDAALAMQIAEASEVASEPVGEGPQTSGDAADLLEAAREWTDAGLDRHADAQVGALLDATIEAHNLIAAGREIAFIDGRLADLTSLVAAIPEGTRIVLIDGSRDGVQQMADALRGSDGITGIHIIAHGQAGSLQLGSSTLDVNSMSSTYRQVLESINNNLAEGADILVYGCNFGAGDAGAEAAALLSALTGADVASSDDLTGAEHLGGDWDLETEVGAVEADEIAATEWNGILADTDADGVDDATDIDDDNDGILDTEEGFDSGIVTVSELAFEKDDTNTGSFTRTGVDGSRYKEFVEFNGFTRSGSPDWSEGQYIINSNSAAQTRTPAIIEQSPAGGGFGIFSVPGEGLSQTLTTVPGETYTVGFWVGSMPYYRPQNATGDDPNAYNLVAYNPTVQLTVASAGGTLIQDDHTSFLAPVTAADFPADINPVNYPGGYAILDPRWQYVERTFVATDASTTFTLQMPGVLGDPVQSVVVIDGMQVQQNSAPTSRDTDSDGLADHLDIDSDNDGITDNIEAQTTDGYIAPTGTDTDGDGLDDAYDATAASGATGSLGLIAVNTDGADLADYLDTDSDNDGTADIAERGDGQPTSISSTTDTDGDGLLDIFEAGTVSDGFDVNDNNLIGTTFNLADTDNDTAANGAGAVPLVNDLDFRDANEPPVAVDDVLTTAEDTLLVTNVITANGIDSDPDSDPLTVVSATIDIDGDGNPDALTLGAATPIIVGGSTIGELSLSVGGGLIFQPAANWNGTVPTLTYTLSDGNNQTDTATVTITVTPVNELPALDLNSAWDPNAVCPSPAILDASVILSGAYDSGSGLMRDDLRAAGLVPLTEPFTALGHDIGFGGGGETTTAGVLAVTGSDAIVDWVLVSLRNGADEIVASRAALLQRDGDIVDVDGTSPVTFNAPAGSYTVTVEHRNHLGVTTALPVAFDGTTASAVDFTSASLDVANPSVADGLERRDLDGAGAGTLMGLWTGDADANGTVDLADEIAAIQAHVLADPGNVGGSANYISTGYATTDLDMDGRTIAQGAGNDVNVVNFAVANYEIQAGLPITLTSDIVGQVAAPAGVHTAMDAACLSGFVDHAATFTEDGPPVAVADIDADAFDADDDITALTIVAGNVSDGAAEVVTIAGQQVALSSNATLTGIAVGGSSVNIAYVAATGTFTITNATGASNPIPQADLDTLIRSITYENTSDDPTAGDRTLTFTATDSANATSAPAVSTITVTPVNDAPVIACFPGAVPYVGTEFLVAIDKSQVTGTAPQLTIIGAPGTSGTVVAPSGTTAFTIDADGAVDVVLTAASSYDTGLSNVVVSVTADAAIAIQVVEGHTSYVDGYMALPKDNLGTHYVISSWQRNTVYSGSANQIGVAAIENGTTFTIRDAAGTVLHTRTINANQVYNYSNAVGSTDLTGATVTADKPVAVYAVAEQMVIPNTSASASDKLVEQMLPTSMLESEYYVAPLPHPYLTRIIATADNTQVTVNGSVVATLNAGQFHQIDGTGALHIESSAAVLVAQYTKGNSTEPGGGSTGDPSMTLAPLPSAFVKSYTVAAADVYTGAAATPARTAVVVIPTAAVASLALDGIAVSAPATAIGTSGYSWIAVTLPDDNGHILTADERFGLTIYREESMGAYSFAGSYSQPTIILEDVLSTLSGFVLTDPDAGAAPVEVTLSVPAGTLTIDAAIPGGLTASQITGNGTGSIIITAPIAAINATAGGGGIAYLSAPNASGDVTVTLSVDDLGNSGSGGPLVTTHQCTFTITPVNDAPVAVDDTLTTAEDTLLVTNVITANGIDSDPDSDPLTVVSATIDIDGDGNPDPLTIGTTTPIIVGGNTIGELSLSATGGLIFAPAANYNGPVPTLTYTLSDGTETDTATVSITVTPVNDQPVGVNDTIPVIEDTPVTVNVLGNDTDPDSDPLTITAAAIDVNGDGTPDTLVLGTPTSITDIGGNPIGTITVAPNGDVTFAPAQDYNGPVPSLTYTPNDGTVDGTPATVTFGPITPANDPPEGADATFDVAINGTHTFSAAEFGFTDPNDNPAHAFKSVIIDTLPAEGTLTLAGVPVTAGQEIAVADIASLVWTAPQDRAGTGLGAFDFRVVDDGPAGDNFVTNGSLEDFVLPGNVVNFPEYNSPAFPTPELISPPELAGWNRAFHRYGSIYYSPEMNLVLDADPATADTPYGDQQGYFGYVWQTISGLTPGETYTVSGDAILEAASAFEPGYFIMQVFDDADYNGIANSSLPPPIAQGELNTDVDGSSPDWRNLTFTFVAPASGTIDLVVEKAQALACNWDNISITRTGQIGQSIDQVANTISFDIAPNDPPEGADNTLTVPEDGSHTFSAADFGFSDPNDTPAHNFVEVIITTLPATGTLQLSGVDVTAGQVIPVADIPNLVWTAPANQFGNGIASFDFQVVDDGQPYQNGNLGPNLVVNGSLEDFEIPDVNGYVEIQGFWDTNPPAAAEISPPELGGWSRAVLVEPNGNGPGMPIYYMPEIYLVEDPEAANWGLPETPHGDQQGYTGLVYQTLSGLTPGATYTVGGSAVIDNEFTMFEMRAIDSANFDGTILIDENTGEPIWPSNVLASAGYDGSVDGTSSNWRDLTFTFVAPASGSIDLLVHKSSMGAAACSWDNISVQENLTVVADTDPLANTITFNVTPVNDPPVAVDDTATTDQNTVVSGDLTPGTPGQDYDLDDAFQVTEINGAAFTSGDTITLPSGALLTINDDGTYTYDPNGVFDVLGSGQQATDTFTYTIEDASAATSSATVTVTINGLDDTLEITGLLDGAIAGTDGSVEESDLATGTTPADTGETVTGTFTLTAIDGIAQVSINGVVLTTPPTPATPIVLPGTYGTLSLTDFDLATGVASYSYELTSDAPHAGAVTDDFVIVMDDSDGDQVTGTLAFAILDDAPIATADTGNATENSGVAATGTVLSNDVGGADGLAAIPVTGVAAGVGVPTGAALNGPLAGSYGDLTLNDDGTWSYAVDGANPAVDGLAAGLTLSDVFTYEITDADGSTSTATLTIVITGVNDPPVATPSTSSGDEDTNIPVNLTGTDVDGTVDFVTVTSLPPVGEGVLYMPDGTTPVTAGTPIPAADAANLVFVPATNFNGTVSIPFTVTDDDGATSAPANEVITINPVNDAPVDGNETNTVSEDGTLVVVDGSADDLLANAFDADGNTMVVTQFTIDGIPGTQAINSIVSIPGVGNIRINDNGSYSFAPTHNFNGAVPTITYTVTDGFGLTDTSTLDITVTPVNDPPVATPSTSSGDEDTNIPVDLTGTDVDGTVDFVTVTTLPPATQGVLYMPNGTTPVVAGTPIPVADAANLVFVPATNFNGTVTIPFTVTDDDGTTSAPANEVITVNPVNDPPVDSDETNTVAEDGTLVVADGSADDLLANATDPDGNTMVVTHYTIDGIPGNQAINSIVTIPSVGTVRINDNGSYSFSPFHNYNGPVPTITYTLTDGFGLIDTSTLDITVTPVNDPPVANPDTTTTGEGVAVVVDLLGNDTDPDGDPLTVTAASVDPAQGTVAFDGTSWVFTPAAGFNGPATISYTIEDQDGATSSATHTVTVTPNDPPVLVDPDPTAGTPSIDPADPSSLLVPATDGVPLSLDLTAYLSDPEGDPLVITPDPTAIPSWLTWNPATNTFTGTPPTDNTGDVSIPVTVDDGINPPYAVTITFQPVNPGPIGVDDIEATQEDALLSGNVLTNDLDPDGDPLTVTAASVDVDGDGIDDVLPLGVATLLTDSSGQPIGTLTLNDDGSYTFEPAPGYNGPVPLVSYTIADADGAVSDATLEITVTPVNDAPVANPDSTSTGYNTPVVVDLLANDTDPDSDPLTVVSATVPPEQGSMSSSGGVWTFTPSATFAGTAIITYTIVDPAGATSTSTHEVTVAAATLSAEPDAYQVRQNGILRSSVAGNDTYPEGSVFKLVKRPKAGKLVMNADGSFTYKPKRGFSGKVRFTYQVTDPTGATRTVRDVITVSSLAHECIVSFGRGGKR